MTTGLRYNFKEETSRGTPLEVTTPKSLYDLVASGHGPLHTNILGNPNRHVFGKRFDKDDPDNVTLDFSLSSNGLSYFHGPAHQRSAITLEIIAQLDMAANRHDLSDPRVSMALSPLGRHAGGALQFAGGEEFFKVSFEQPKIDPGATTGKIKRGMIQAADLWHMYDGTDHSVSAAVTATDEGHLDLRMGMHSADRLILTTDRAAQLQEGRVNLYDPLRNEPEQRLAALVGVISALDPVA